MTGKKLIVLLCIFVFIGVPSICSAVLSGELTTGYPHVGIIQGENVFSTGTAIADGWVLTAGHVARNVSPGDLFNLGANSYSVTGVYVNPEIDLLQSLNYNLGLLRVAGMDLASYPTLLSSGIIYVGDPAVFVGLGLDESGNYGSKRTGTTMIDAVDFNHFFTSNGSVGAFGDDGAPAFIDRGYGLILAGVLSFGSQEGQWTAFEKVTVNRSWIDATVGAGVVNWGLSGVDPANPVPIPGTLLLFAPGLVGLAALRIRVR